MKKIIATIAFGLIAAQVNAATEVSTGSRRPPVTNQLIAIPDKVDSKVATGSRRPPAIM